MVPDGLCVSTSPRQVKNLPGCRHFPALLYVSERDKEREKDGRGNKDGKKKGEVSSFIVYSSGQW